MQQGVFKVNRIALFVEIRKQLYTHNFYFQKDVIRGLISRTYLFVGYLEIVDFDFFYCYANLKLQNDRLSKDLICLAISSERKKGLVEQGQGQVLVGHYGLSDPTTRRQRERRLGSEFGFFQP